MDLFELLTGQLLSKNTLSELASESNADASQVETLTKLAIPTMMEALQKNASTDEGKKSLDKALDQHQKDPSNLLGFLKGADQEDGAKILNHMFGSQKDAVTQNLASSSGLDISTVISLLTKYAPMILSMLAMSKMTSATKKTTTTKSEKSGSTGMDLTDILSDLTGRSKEVAKKSAEPNILDGLKDILGGFLK